MKYIRKRVLAGELVTGTWLNLGSSLTAEIAGRAGFDWLLIDMEHGAGDQESLVHQLQAIDIGPSVALVRIAWNEAPRFKRALDLGPGGIMVPYINTPEEARQAAAAMRFSPTGVRGAARFNRAVAFGQDFETYFAEANDNLLTVIQIESPEAVANAEAIAAVDGVDVLFIGPLDLSVNMGMMGQFQHPEFRAALAKVVAAAKGAGKAAGILLANPDLLPQTIADGFTFVAVGSDGHCVASGMKNILSAFAPYR